MARVVSNELQLLQVNRFRRCAGYITTTRTDQPKPSYQAHCFLISSTTVGSQEVIPFRPAYNTHHLHRKGTAPVGLSEIGIILYPPGTCYCQGEVFWKSPAAKLLYAPTHAISSSSNSNCSSPVVISDLTHLRTCYAAIIELRNDYYQKVLTVLVRDTTVAIPL